MPSFNSTGLVSKIYDSEPVNLHPLGLSDRGGLKRQSTLYTEICVLGEAFD